MSFVFASMLALAPAAAPAAPAGDRAGADADAPEVTVPIDIGPPLVRRMGVRITVRRAGDDPVMHRPVDVHELPRPAYSDDVPPPVRIELSPGDYLLEAEAQGFLPSTRALTVAAGSSPVAVVWQLLPDSAHRTVQFPVVVADDDPPVSLTARQLEGDQTTVSCTARRVPCELRLRRGEWELQASAPGYRSLRRVFTVGNADAQSVDLALEPGFVEPALPEAPAVPRPTQPPPGDRRKLVLGFSLAAVPLVAAGLPLTIVGPLRYGQNRNSSTCELYGATCADAIIPAIHLGGAGAGLLGAGIGVAATAITAARAKANTSWWIQFGVGGALAVAGGAWLVGNSVLLDRDLKTGPLAEIDARVSPRAASSFLLGAGLGLAGGGLTGMLLRRARPVARLGPFGGPDRAGVTLTGEF